MSSVKEIIELLPSQSEGADLIERAYEFAEKAHEGQERFTGEPYFTHVFATAKTLAELKMDPQTIAAGLLHDVIEDCNVTEEEVERLFGKEILFLVQGVTKLGTLKYRGVERHVESLRKLFIATAQDVRVLIIKLADRLHNVATLDGHNRPDKQKRIAVETLEIYAPLANRLGIGRLKGELEDYAFPYVYPEDYEQTRELLRQKSKLDQKYLERVRRNLQKELAKNGIRDAHTDYRIKRLYSLFRKLQRKDMDINKIYDLVALRIVVPTVEDCYRVLGIIHGTWRPLLGRIKDYIANPKPNGYQSLHTTIFTGDGGIVEVQVRTAEMHAEAEYGIAAHFAYKEEKKGFFSRGLSKGYTLSKKLAWINQLFEWQKHVDESGEFLETLDMDFFCDRVFIFTPKGDVVDLPIESTPIDFAYAIHSDIGNHMFGAMVNNKMVSINTPLNNGDIVEIQTKKSSHPTQKWLEGAKTTLAKRHIRNALGKEG